MAALPLVIPGERNGRHRTKELLNSLMAHGLKPNVLMCCESPDSVKAVVRNGDAAGILYEDLVEVAVEKGLFQTLKVTGVDLGEQSYIVYSKEKPLSHGAKDFLGLLRAMRSGSRPMRKTLQTLD